jgi:hypothetical protein
MSKPKTMSTIEKAMNLIVAGQTDAALGVLWRLHHEAYTDTIDQLAANGIHQIVTAHDSLPPMKQIRGRRVRAIDVACGACGAKAGSHCFRMTSRGRNGVPTDEVQEGQFHGARYSHAKRKMGVNV